MNFFVIMHIQWVLETFKCIWFCRHQFWISTMIFDNLLLDRYRFEWKTYYHDQQRNRYLGLDYKKGNNLYKTKIKKGINRNITPVIPYQFPLDINVVKLFWNITLNGCDKSSLKMLFQKRVVDTKLDIYIFHYDHWVDTSVCALILVSDGVCSALTRFMRHGLLLKCAVPK